MGEPPGLGVQATSDYTVVASKLVKLFEKGPINYKPSFEDAPDGEHIASLTPGLLEVMTANPNNNCNWQTYKLAILKLMCQQQIPGQPAEAGERNVLA